jgi:hypothetical protein
MTALDGSEVVMLRHNGNDVHVPLRDAVRAGRDQEVVYLDGTSLTLTADRAFVLVVTRNAASTSITVPAGMDIAPQTNFPFRQGGTGSVTFVAGSGVTINTPETLIIAKQNALAMLIYEGNDVYTLVGNLQAA